MGHFMIVLATMWQKFWQFLSLESHPGMDTVADSAWGDSPLSLPLRDTENEGLKDTDCSYFHQNILLFFFFTNYSNILFISLKKNAKAYDQTNLYGHLKIILNVWSRNLHFGHTKAFRTSTAHTSSVFLDFQLVHKDCIPRYVTMHLNYF